MNHFICSALSSLLPYLIRTKGKQHLSILIYHRVLPTSDVMRPDEPTVAQFDWQMEVISRYMNPLSLNDALGLLEDNELPENAICVTFDDGYADNAICALPILRKWNIPATVFVSTGFLDGGIMWNDSVLEAIRVCGNTLDLSSLGMGVKNISTDESRKIIAHEVLKEIKHKNKSERDSAVAMITSQAKSKLPEDLMLTSQQLIDMNEMGVEIGGHTITHPILSKLDLNESKQEIIDGKKKLEIILNKSIRYFAYPNGQPGNDYTPDHCAIAKECGFEAALSTRWGVSSALSDKYQLARFTPWDKTPAKFLLRLLRNQNLLKL